ncbi:hypothetical protein BS50DRAFT_576978 [Corynespora cassiicola Philippines]|uniref:Uncharacterized protein n=1 Tax=Corynespora cassiicola Philippines TaxID=1448308 RepID=A0A2T2NDS3_CORCC|nr:hypothetical protein BS50DRAFT_576978 [Corynespora cassiicola Philippines]
MTTNAPYYQMRGQFNSANAQFAPADDDYDLSAPVTPHDASLYSDRQGSDNAVNPLEENHNLVELLEAATTAAGQSAQAMNVDATDAAIGMLNKGKRKRFPTPSADEHSSITHQPQDDDAASDPKRNRIEVPTDPQLQSPEHDVRGRSESGSVPPSSESLLNDARAAGVHSAAALFRRSSKETTRKYTRPPMSKLFMSLQLTPENFLHLQAQAKSYMLDPAHPERQHCVGNRGKGDTDMVKLRLFNCVREFLEDGVGERFFGEHVEKPGEKEADEAAQALGEEKVPSEGKLVWPRDGNKIIGLVTPLLRRMVTNERQRMYAIETRKGGTKKKESSVEAVQHHNDPAGFGNANAGLEHLQTQYTPSSSLMETSQHQQHYQPTSPVSSLSIHPQPTTPNQANFAMSPSMRTSAEMSSFEQLDLPTQHPAEAKISQINIYLAKNGFKLTAEKKIFGTPSDNLFFTTYQELQNEIHLLIKTAMSIYPALGPSPVPYEIEQALQGMAPEALRGLAVAATEMQANSSDANDEGADTIDSAPVSHSTSASGGAPTTPTSPFHVRRSVVTPSTVLPISKLPKHIVKVMETQGLTTISNVDEWHHAKLDLAYAVWAGNMVNVVVDLI